MTNDQMMLLADKAEIHECLVRYCHGMDNYDRALVLSAYHSGATDDHGPYKGSAEGLVEWAFTVHREMMNWFHHKLTTARIEVDGTTARAFSYCTFTGELKSGAMSVNEGRYMDQFEKRNGKWGIVDRVSAHVMSFTVQTEPHASELKATLKEGRQLATARSANEGHAQRLRQS